MPPGFGLPALEFCLGKDMRGIHSDLAKCVENVGSVAHQTADFGIRARRVDKAVIFGTSPRTPTAEGSAQVVGAA